MHSLQTALRVAGVWQIVVGLVMMFPFLGEAFLAYDAVDGVLMSGWGAAMLVTGLITLAAARMAEGYTLLVHAIGGGFLISSLNLLYHWSTGAYSMRNILILLVVHVVLMLWIWFERPSVNVNRV